MADWNLPATTSTYVDVLANLKDRDLDVAKLFDGVTVTNPATGMIRWSSANLRLEKWDGTAWVALAATHAISISGSSASTTGNAATATALQTARTINGTSFNGTANVTTSLWGTARTITIGSTGKSVDGSANVSWSLGEIGAAAASHTHSYLPLTGGTVTGAVTVNAQIRAETDFGDGGLSQVKLMPPAGANGSRGGAAFHATFGSSADTVPRRAADIWAGYDGGVWGTEFLSIGVGGATDSANVTTERVRVTASGMSVTGSVGVSGNLTAVGKLSFSNATTTDDHIQLYGAGSATGYGIGVESGAAYFRSNGIYRWYSQSLANGGTANVRMSLSAGGDLTVGGTVTANTFNGNFTPTAPATLSGTAIAWGTNAKYHATISANTTLSFSSNPAVGTTCLLHVTHTAGTITWPSSVRWPGGVAPTLTTNRTHIFMFYWDGSLYRGSFLRNYTTA